MAHALSSVASMPNITSPPTILLYIKSSFLNYSSLMPGSYILPGDLGQFPLCSQGVPLHIIGQMCTVGETLLSTHCNKEQVRKKHLIIYYDKEVTKCCGIALSPGITILTANRWLNASFNNMRLVRIAIAPFAVGTTWQAGARAS